MGGQPLSSTGPAPPMSLWRDSGDKAQVQAAGGSTLAVGLTAGRGCTQPNSPRLLWSSPSHGPRGDAGVRPARGAHLGRPLLDEPAAGTREQDKAGGRCYRETPTNLEPCTSSLVPASRRPHGGPHSPGGVRTPWASWVRSAAPAHGGAGVREAPFPCPSGDGSVQPQMPLIRGASPSPAGLSWKRPRPRPRGPGLSAGSQPHLGSPGDPLHRR